MEVGAVVTPAAGFAMLVSMVIPFIVGFVTKASWNGAIKFAIAVVLSLAVGFGTVALSGEVPLDNWWLLLIGSILAAKSTYWLFIKDTGIKEWLAAHGIADKPSD